MRKICYTSLKRTILIVLISVLIAAAVISLFVFMLSVKPDLLDENRITGVPSDLPKEQGYRSFSADKICDVALCGNPMIKGEEVKLFLTNPESNTVWLRAEIYTVSFIYDENGKLKAALPDEKLGQSGFIKPGEYVESVFLSDQPEKSDSGVPVKIKISTYVEDTAASQGSFYIDTYLFP